MRPGDDDDVDDVDDNLGLIVWFLEIAEFCTSSGGGATMLNQGGGESLSSEGIFASNERAS